MIDKKNLRRTMKQLLNAMDAETIQKQSQQACIHAMQCTVYIKANIILAYAAMQQEISPALLVAQALQLGKQVAFPVCNSEGHSLVAAIPTDENSWERDQYGIWTPMLDRSKVIGNDELDLVIVPGLAFDRLGNRLGRGAGYYDRFLQQTKAYRLGFAFSEQIVDHILPSELHDCTMHAIVTPEKFMEVSDQSRR